uniref:Uncharacterized protein n=1 Tax=Arundo donax TaxID=35708 RepID=A0A0A9CS87_ARUDO
MREHDMTMRNHLASLSFYADHIHCINIYQIIPSSGTFADNSIQGLIY